MRMPALALVVLVAGIAFPATAQELSDSGTDAHAGVRMLYDTNFFRIDNSLEDSGGVDPRGLDDTIFSAFAGLTSTLRFGSNQDLFIDAEINTNQHDKYTEADYTGGDLLARYDWRVGAATYGNLSYSYVVEPVDFANQDTPRIDFRLRQNVDFELNRKLGPRWTIGAGGGFTNVEFDLVDRPEVNRQNAFLRLVYESRQGNRLAFVGAFQERESNNSNDLGFDEYAVGPDLTWRISSDLRFDVALRYQERDPVDPTLTAFDGPTGNLKLTWGLSDEMLLELEAYRIVSSLADQLSNFAIIDGQRLRMQWFVSRRVSYYISADREDRDFELEPSLVPVPGLAPRNDVIVLLRAGLRWDPRSRLHLEAFVGNGDRSSNRQFRDFRYEVFQFEFSYSFL
jgi:hypothetical protein